MARHHPQRQQGLCALMCESFTPAEFVGFIERCEAFDESAPYRLIHNLLPYEYTPAEPYFQHALEVMTRRNLIDARFLAAMAHERPLRAQRIGLAAKALGIDIREVCDGISASCDHPDLCNQSELGPGEARRRAAVDQLDELLRRRFESTGPSLANKEEIIRLSEGIINSFTPRPGLVVAGAILERRHEAGAFGQIWLSRSVDDPSRLLATKIIHLHHLRSGQFLYHFRRGCRAMQILNMAKRSGQAPSIVQLHGLSGDTLAFSMDYLPNGNLVEIAALQWSLETKLAKFRRVCEAIGFAHRNGITHRDIRPANIVLDAKNDPVVTDFDIADAEFFTRLSISVRLGTQAFAAPEQLRGKKRGEANADVYSLGRLLHFMLIERDPPESKFSRAVGRSLRSFPQILARIIMRATAEDPRERYPSVAALLSELDRHEVDTEIRDAPASPSAPALGRRVAVGSSLTTAVGGCALWLVGGVPAADSVRIAEVERGPGPGGSPHVPFGPNPSSSPPPPPPSSPPRDVPTGKAKPLILEIDPAPPELPAADLTNMRGWVSQRMTGLTDCRKEHFASLDGSVKFIVMASGGLGELDFRFFSHPYREDFRTCMQALLSTMEFAPAGHPRAFILHFGCAKGPKAPCTWKLETSSA